MATGRRRSRRGAPAPRSARSWWIAALLTGLLGSCGGDVTADDDESAGGRGQGATGPGAGGAEEGGTSAGGASSGDPVNHWCMWWWGAAADAVACAGSLRHGEGNVAMGGWGGAPLFDGVLVLTAPLGGDVEASFYYEPACTLVSVGGGGRTEYDQVQATSDAPFQVRVFAANGACAPEGEALGRVVSSDGSAVLIPSASPVVTKRPAVIVVTPTFAGQSVRFEPAD